MSSTVLDLTLIAGTAQRNRLTRFRQLIIAGWTARDPAATEAHIHELEMLGVARPATTPIYYRVSAARLTTDSSIEVSGEQSSGEAECVLACIDDRLWIGIGSDHTDREAEKTGVTLSKQMCEKPIGTHFWLYDDVLGHWDSLELRAYVVERGQRRLYQQGSVAAMLRPDLLAAKSPDGTPDSSSDSAFDYAPDCAGTLSADSLMFCGTLPAIGGIRPAPRFEIELVDPVLRRSLHHGYDIVSLPVRG